VLRIGQGRRSLDTIATVLPPELVVAAADRHERLEIGDVDGVVPCPGARDLLGALAGGSMPWAVVTSCTVPLARARMGAAGLPLPEVLVTAESVSTGKPDPQGYRLAAHRLGVPIGDCVVVEDAPAGVQAGRTAGATVLGVGTGPLEPTGADLFVASLDQVILGTGTLTVRSS
jgi:mannitol-1-/sugar-/sorbitol-6-phosphatase